MRDPRRIRLLFALAVVTSITLLAAGSGLIGGNLRSATQNIFSPLQSAGRAMASPLHNVSTALRDLDRLRRENADLKAQNDSLHRRVVQALDEHRRLRQLESTLDLAGKGEYTVVAANVTAWPHSDDTGATIQIDAGRKDGVKRGMTVLTERGLVGATIAVSKNTSIVRLLTDPDSHVGIRVARSSAIGLASGGGRDELMSLDMFSMRELHVGDAVVTRGSLNGVPFVPGVPVGRITSVGGTAGELPIGFIEPYVDVNALTAVAVVVKAPARDPRDSLIPKPLPTPTITVTQTMTVSPAPNASSASNPSSTASPKPKSSLSSSGRP